MFETPCIYEYFWANLHSERNFCVAGNHGLKKYINNIEQQQEQNQIFYPIEKRKSFKITYNHLCLEGNTSLVFWRKKYSDFWKKIGTEIRYIIFYYIIFLINFKYNYIRHVSFILCFFATSLEVSSLSNFHKVWYYIMFFAVYEVIFFKEKKRVKTFYQFSYFH